MNKIERIKLIKAMEFIARQVNNEEVFEEWLLDGVADGDIKYGDLDVGIEDTTELYYYMEDDNLAYLMDLFMGLMKNARRHGGLYCDDVTSKG